MANTEVGIKLTLSGDQQVRTALSGVEERMDRLTGAVSRAGHYGAAFIGLTQGLIPVAQAAVRAADSVTTLNNQLKLATGSTQAASKAYEALFDIAQRSRVSFTELGGTFASISRAGQELGLNQQRLLGVTEAIGNAMTISGGSAESMNAALVQLGQGLASGTLRGEELNSVMEQTPRLAKAIADGLGVPIGKLREMGAAGEISAEQVIRALESQSAVLRGEVTSSVLTVGQAMTQMQNAAVLAIGEMDKATGASSLAASALSTLATTLGEVGQAFKENELAIKAGMGALGGAAVGAGLLVAAGNIGKITLAVRALGVALAANPYVLAAMGIAAAGGAFVAYSDAKSNTLDAMKTRLKDLQSLEARGDRGMYGNKVSDEALAKRRAEIKRLQLAIAELDSVNLDTRAEDARMAAMVKNTKAAEADREAYANLSRSLSGFKGNYKEYTDNVALINRLRDRGAISEKEAAQRLDELAKKHGLAAKAVKGNKEAERELAEQRRNDIKVGELRNQQIDERLKFEAELAKQQAAVVAQEYESADATNAQALARELANDKTVDATLAMQQLTLAQLEQQRLDLEATDNVIPGYIQALEARIAAQKRLIAATQTGITQEASDKAAKESVEAWRKASDKIEDALTDALMRGFESGKDFAQSLRDTVVNMFKTMVLRPVIQAIVTPVMGAFGLPASAGQGGSAGSSFGLMDAYSAFKTSTASEWFTNFGGSLSDAAYNAGGSLYRAGFESLGDSAFELGKFLDTFKSEINMAGDALGYLNAAAMASEGRWGAAIGSAAGTYFGGPIGSFIGSTIGSAIDDFFAGDSGTPHRGGAYSTDLTGNGYAANDSNTAGFGLSWGAFRSDRSAGVDDALKALSIGLAATVKSALTGFGIADNYRISTKFASDNNDGSVGGLRITNGAGDVISSFDRNNFASDPEKGFSEFSAAAAASIRDALVSADIPGWARGILKSIGDAPSLDQLSAAVANINSVSSSLRSLADVMPQLAGLSDEATTGLLSVFGGIENLKSAAASYYQNYYTEAERAGTATRQVSEAMAAIGLVMPETREGFRDLVEAQDLSTESGRATYAALMGLESVFSALVPSTDNLAAMAQQAGDAISSLVGSLTESIAQSRSAVAEARASLGANQKPLTYADLVKQVGGIGVAPPSRAALDKALAGVSSAQSVVNDKQASLTVARDAAAARIDAAQSAYKPLYDSAKTSYDKALEEYGRYAAYAGGPTFASTSYFDLATPSEVLNDDYKGGFSMPGVAKYSDTVWAAYNYTQSTLPQIEKDAAAAVSTANAALTAAQSTLATARISLTQAEVAYTASMKAWVETAGTSVAALDRLRESTVDYYKQQEELATLMLASAASLRGAVRLARLDVMASEKSLETRLSDYDKTYTLALSASGSIKAGYADRMAADLPQLSQDLMSQSASRAEWVISVARLTAKADRVASQLESTIPTNYQAEANTLLGLIDDKLLLLNDAAKQSENALKQAVTDGSNRTAAGLQQIINQLQGKSVTAFAAGGTFSNGIVTTATVAPQALFGEAGPEAIMPLARGPGGVLGVRMLAGAGDSEAAASADMARLLRDLVDENRRLNGQMNDLKQEVSQMRKENNLGNSQLATDSKLMRRLQEKWDVTGLPVTTQAA